jgi:hypothetical protein
MATKRASFKKVIVSMEVLGSHVLFVHDGSHNPQVIKTLLYLGKTLILDALWYLVHPHEKIEIKTI